MKFFIEHPAFVVEVHLDEAVLHSRFVANFRKAFRRSCSRSPDAVIRVDTEPERRETMFPIETDSLTIERRSSRGYSYSGVRISGDLDVGRRGVSPVQGRFATVMQLDHILAVLNIAISHILVGKGMLLVHSSSVLVDGRAVAFMGRQGAGKTTLARLVVGKLERARPISSDMSILSAARGAGPRIIQGLVDFDDQDSFRGWGSLTTLCRISGWVGNRSVPLRRSAGLASLMENVLIWTPCREMYGKALATAARISRVVPIHDLWFTRGERAVDVVEDLAAGHATRRLGAE